MALDKVSLATDGARNIWYLMSLLKDVDQKHARLMECVLTNNSYYAHPENILLAMLVDSRKETREFEV